MFYFPVLEWIKRFIKDNYYVPDNPAKSRVTLFWVIIFTLSMPLAILVNTYVAPRFEPWSYLILGYCLLLLAYLLATSKASPEREAIIKQARIDWWLGKGKWWEIIFVKKVK